MSPESPNVGPRRRSDARRNREAILAAARQLFDERGPDVAFDEVAKAAGIGNATLYRHFATRAELLVTVYAAEVRGLEALGEQLSDHDDAEAALAEWLRAFVRHVADKRDLAQAVPAEPGIDRGALFQRWHATMLATAQRLLARAQAVGCVRPDLTTSDLLGLAGGIALTGLPPARLDGLLDLIRDGYRAPGPGRGTGPSRP